MERTEDRNVKLNNLDTRGLALCNTIICAYLKVDLVVVEIRVLVSRGYRVRRRSGGQLFKGQ